MPNETNADPLAKIGPGIYDLTMRDGRTVRAEVGMAIGSGLWWWSTNTGPGVTPHGGEDWREVVAAERVGPSAPTVLVRDLELEHTAGRIEGMETVRADGCPHNECRIRRVCTRPFPVAHHDCLGHVAQHRCELLGKLTHRLGTGSYEEALVLLGDKLEQFTALADEVAEINRRGYEHKSEPGDKQRWRNAVKELDAVTGYLRDLVAP